VVAAGNTGYGWNQSAFRGAVAAGMDLTINDPGNAEGAITVGATHRDMPHVYGVSYFSSKGPTGDGRLKPDLVAPGEKIISCQVGGSGVEDGGGSVGAARANVVESLYKEDSGTSMAAPHVSGVIAAFLSIRREFIGQPDRVKDIFMATATDLRRDRCFQGRGLVDLMRAIQSV
jgi:subtilisin family serine protease